MFHNTTRKARQWGGLRLFLRTGCSIAITVLFAYLLPREQTHKGLSARIEPRAARAVPALIRVEGPVASPAVNEDAQWFGLCSANAATTVAGFKTQVMNSPQLRERYKHFDWGNASVVENRENLYSSVLYKKNGQIYWTRKLLLIKKGEKVLTDGKIRVRTYCCNQIALAPPGPFLPPSEEPPPEDIQPPEVPGLPDFPATPPAIDIPPELFTYIPPPTIFPPPPPAVRTPIVLFAKRPSPGGPRGSRIPVPEPGTFILMVSGLAALAFSYRRRNRYGSGSAQSR